MKQIKSKRAFRIKTVLSLIAVSFMLLTASACSTTYTLTLNATTGGRVQGGGSYKAGQVATLTATKDSGYNFDGWFDGDTKLSDSVTYDYTMPSKNITITAKFSIAPATKYSLTFEEAENGTVTGTPGLYAQGSVITITAQPDEGYRLQGWYFNDVYQSNDEEYEFAMPANAVVVSAVFEEIIYSELSFGTPLNGTITGTAGTYADGTVIKVTATPAEEYFLEGWYFNGVYQSNDEEYEFAMPRHNLVITAVFKIKTYALTFTVAGQGSVTCIMYKDEEDLDGTEVTGGKFAKDVYFDLLAEPAEGYYFDGWYFYDELVSESEDMWFSMPNADLTVKAVFVAFHALTYIEPQNGDITMYTGAEYTEIGGCYAKDEAIAIFAEPKAGYYFDGWYFNGKFESYEEYYYFYMPGCAVEITAVFSLKHGLSCVEPDEGEISLSNYNPVQGDYGARELITVIATAYTGYYFDGWKFNGVYMGNAESYTFKMPGENLVIEAVFVEDRGIADSFAGGTGTEADPYTIATSAQLRYLSVLVNSGNNASLNLYFKLTADIDLQGKEWMPIGKGITNNTTYTRAFQGYFDGNGKTVSNLKITGKNHITTLSNQLYAGLFGLVYRAEIKNLTLTGVDIDIDYKTSAAVMAGGLAAAVTGTAAIPSVIQNCHISGQIKAVTLSGCATGGVAGNAGMANRILDCSFTGNIEVSANNKSSGGAAVNVGGIIGLSASSGTAFTTITNCHTQGSLSAKSASGTPNAFGGGITGTNTGVIEYCYSDMDIDVVSWNYAYASGIGTNPIANAPYSVIKGCYSTGTISSTARQYAYAGGITASNATIVEKCWATGYVDALSPTRDPYAGGIVGSNSGTIKNCYATCDVWAYGQNYYAYAGGIAGTNTAAIENCYAIGDVIAQSPYMCAAGGIVGHNNGIVKNCFATTNVSASVFTSAADQGVFAGGIVGYYNEDSVESIDNCFAYKGQLFIANTAGFETSEATNQMGTPVTLDTLNSAVFYSTTLKWDNGIWDFTGLDFAGGIYPSIKIPQD